MVSPRGSRLRFLPMILLLFFQAWSCASFNENESKWVTKRLSRGAGLERHTFSRKFADAQRKLQEAPEKSSPRTPSKNPQGRGLRANLVDVHSEARNGLTTLQRIQRDVVRSESRARSLDDKARKAPYQSHQSGPGRKTLDINITSEVSATPGSYAMEFSIGTPPQTFHAIADTGSDLVWLQCKPCQSCFNQSSPIFDPGQSSTYEAIGCGAGCDALGHNQLACSPNCQYTYRYGDQSNTQGDFSLETVTLTTTDGTLTTIPKFQFGCGHTNEVTFNGADGLVGLARGPISFPSQISASLNEANKFSYCLVSRYDEVNASSPLLFGAAALPSGTPELVATPILTPYDTSVVPYYYVDLLDVSVGGVGVGLPASSFAIDASGNGGIIFDSGTTYTVLSSEPYTTIMSKYSSLMTEFVAVDLANLTGGLEFCYDITGLASVRIPQLTFHFQGADMDLPFDNIMVLFGDGSSNYMCLAFLGRSSSGLSIFGNVQQQNFLVLYDEQNLQIGWSDYSCKDL